MIEVEIADPAWTGALPDAAALAEAAAAAVLAEVAATNHGDVAILLADDTAVRALNARFRNEDRPTNVLSFPAGPGVRDHAGDIVLAYGVCAREAAEQAKPLGQHLQHLAVHGVLHLLGFDHQDDSAAVDMEGHERRILQGLGVPDPYAPRSWADARDV